MAIDFLANYPGSYGRLSKHVGINVSTRIAELEKHFGGCAMNIAYSLQQFGRNAMPFVMAGRTLDRDYLEHIRSTGTDQRGIIKLDEWPHSSHGFIFTDRDNNQFTSFFSGPATVSDYRDRLEVFLNDYGDEISFAIIAPDLARNMIDAAQLLYERSIPFMTDPGQGLSDFSRDECNELIAASRIALMNEFEREYLEQNVPDLMIQLETLITTCGSEGVRWTDQDGSGRERAAVPHKIVDPTGCGDAFRAGFVHAYLAKASMRESVRCGALTASINIEHKGCQSHSLGQFADRYEAEWGGSPSWLQNSLAVN